MKRSALLLLALAAPACGSTIIDGDETGGGPIVVLPPGGGGAGLGNQGGSGDGGSIVPNGGAPPIGGEGAGPIGGSGGSGGEDPGVFDCATAPTTVQSTKALPGVRGYHGLAINDLGLMHGVDQNGNLIRSTYDGAWTPFLSNIQADQMEFAPDGDLHLASFNSVLTATPSAQLLTLSGQGGGYGLRMGPDGKVWIADAGDITRIDPSTGIVETVVTFGGSETAHSFDFNRTFDKLYVGFIGSQGHVRKVDLDASYNAVGAAQAFAQMPTGNVWLDGIATDVCGNLYIANYTTSDMFRVTPAGVATLYFDWSSSQYGHGAIFGNGKFGFREDAIYVPQPYNGNTVMEIVIGIPGREWDGTVLNGPTP